MTGRVSVYLLCGNANKIYLDALQRRHSVLLPLIAENDCECKMTAEYDCPETNREELIDCTADTVTVGAP